MRAVLFDQPGDPEVLYVGEVPAPVCGAEEVRIAVTATAVNRADLMQRRGLYPPPKGASTLLGLEAAGRITELGSAAPAGKDRFTLGQPVMALLAGGGYAEEVVVPQGQVMPIPPGLSEEQAAAIPEVFLTAFLNLFILSGLRFVDRGAAGRTVLVHGGASGVGSAALQLLKASGATALCTVGSEERIPSCLELGASAAFCYRTTDFVAAVQEATQGQGADVILDCVGGSYLERNLRALAPDGRLICIGLQGGSRAELDLGLVLSRRLQVIGSTLRALPLGRKAALVRAFCEQALPLFARGELRPVIDRVLPLEQAAAAHRALDQHHVGKVVLRVRDRNTEG
jgi:putative PIG3 family NAD(P)H quinone oxidoreductase